jgi:hypothetical protein
MNEVMILSEEHRIAVQILRFRSNTLQGAGHRGDAMHRPYIQTSPGDAWRRPYGRLIWYRFLWYCEGISRVYAAGRV